MCYPYCNFEDAYIALKECYEHILEYPEGGYDSVHQSEYKEKLIKLCQQFTKTMTELSAGL